MRVLVVHRQFGEAVADVVAGALYAIVLVSSIVVEFTGYCCTSLRLQAMIDIILVIDFLPSVSRFFLGEESDSLWNPVGVLATGEREALWDVAEEGVPLDP